MTPKPVKTILTQIACTEAFVNHRMDLRVSEECATRLILCRWRPTLNVYDNQQLVGSLVGEMTKCQDEVRHWAYSSYKV